MEISKRVGQNLRKIRSSRKLSLDQLSTITGVSKGLLGQIERGESNPTVSTLWKIASGLRISFTMLMKEEEQSVRIVDKTTVKPFEELQDQYRVFPMFTYEPKNRFEIFTIELDAHAEHRADAHHQGVGEYIIVTKGELVIQVGKQEFTMKQGNAIHFIADIEHRYINRKEEMVQAVLVIAYPEQ